MDIYKKKKQSENTSIDVCCFYLKAAFSKIKAWSHLFPNLSSLCCFCPLIACYFTFRPSLFSPLHSPFSSPLLCHLSNSLHSLSSLWFLSLAFLWFCPSPPFFLFLLYCSIALHHSSFSTSSPGADTPLCIFSHRTLQLLLMPHKKPRSNDDQDPAAHMWNIRSEWKQEITGYAHARKHPRTYTHRHTHTHSVIPTTHTHIQSTALVYLARTCHCESVVNL